MQTLHDAHIKEMTKLRYELEQARTEGHCPCICCPEYVHACNIHVAESDDCISDGSQNAHPSGRCTHCLQLLSTVLQRPPKEEDPCSKGKTEAALHPAEC